MACVWLWKQFPPRQKRGRAGRERKEGRGKEGRGGKGRGEERRAELSVLSTPIVPMPQRLRREEQFAASQLYIEPSDLFSPPPVKMAA